eukprot:TRINITY_DN1201_c0_g1_i1.p1 TRINITY_DN1201_c0_g1~~TRINITY_DN1201_c0_g1_i1.p1  ORF type:complete len:686 (+),score=41.23 TRINITY_DN1201_c0_g1_i1:108-2060(+)
MEFVLYIILGLLSFCATGLLLYFYARKDTPWVAYIAAFAGWFSGFMLVAILPYDIYIVIFVVLPSLYKTLNDPDKGQLALLKTLWNIIYWTGFLLCWVVLPILTTYLDACEFTVWGKLRYSLKINMIYYAIEIGAFIILAVFYVITNGRPTMEHAKGLLMALASAWALVQIILFLSNGIIDVPRDLWRRTSIQKQLKTVCCKMVQAQEILDDNKIILEQCIKKLQAIEIVCTEDNKEYINKIYEIIPEDLTTFRTLTGAINPDVEVGTSREQTKSRIFNIHYKIKSTLHEYAVYRDSYERLVKEGIFLENLIYSIETKKDYIFEIGKKRAETRLGHYMERFRFLWHKTLLPILYFFIAILCTLYGIIVVLGECSLVYPDYHKYLSPLGYLLATNKHYMITLLITVPTLAMFIAYAYYGLFNFRLSKFYGLFPHRQTDPSCLVYSAMFTAKLAFPICYNYLLLVSLLSRPTDPDAKLQTVFEKVMGAIDLVPYMGSHFQQYFPCIIFLFLILNGCEIYSRIMKALMLENYAFILDVSFSKYDLGLVLLNNERKKVEANSISTEPMIKGKPQADRVRPLTITPPPGSLKKSISGKNVHGNKVKKVVSKKRAIGDDSPKSESLLDKHNSYINQVKRRGVYKLINRVMHITIHV